MKLTEKQAFKVMNKIMGWADETEVITEEERAEFVMKELINLELGNNEKQIDKIELHLKAILDDCKNFFGGKETGQIEHNVFEIREHLKNEDYE